MSCAPQQRYTTGEPGKVQGQDHVGIVEGSCGYRARGISIRGKYVVSRNLGYKTRGSLKLALWLNLVLTPGSLRRRQSSVTGSSASCGYCCPLCPGGGSVPGEIRFIETQWVNGHRRPVPGAASSGIPRESQTNFRDGTVWGL